MTDQDLRRTYLRLLGSARAFVKIHNEFPDSPEIWGQAYRRGNEMRTCDAEIDRLGLEHVPHCTCAPLPEPASDDCPIHVESI